MAVIENINQEFFHPNMGSKNNSVTTRSSPLTTWFQCNHFQIPIYSDYRANILTNNGREWQGPRSKENKDLFATGQITKVHASNWLYPVFIICLTSFGYKENEIINIEYNIVLKRNVPFPSIPTALDSTSNIRIYIIQTELNWINDWSERFIAMSHLDTRLRTWALLLCRKSKNPHVTPDYSPKSPNRIHDTAAMTDQVYRTEWYSHHSIFVTRETRKC